MGYLTETIPQGPNRHCGSPEPHERHVNLVEPEAIRVEDLVKPRRLEYDGSWCDGVPPLQPFLELTVRVPIVKFFGGSPEANEHAVVLGWLVEEGLGIIVDEMGEGEGVSTVLRVRTSDGIDRVYPVAPRRGGALLPVMDHDPS